MAKQNKDQDSYDDLYDDDEPDGEEGVFDLADVEEAHFGALPKGRYLCKVVDCKLDKIKSGDNAGQPQLRIRFKPVFPASNKLVFKNAGLKGKAAPYTKGLLAHLGVDLSAGPLRPSEVVTDSEGNDRLIWLQIIERKDRAGDNDIASTEAYDGSPYGEDEGDDEAV